MIVDAWFQMFRADGCRILLELQLGLCRRSPGMSMSQVDSSFRGKHIVISLSGNFSLLSTPPTYGLVNLMHHSD